jgi:aryl-alcohol dehydrogenase-like predicted oxidoreductase
LRYKKFGNTGLTVSEIGLGTWAYGNDYFGSVDDNQSIDAIRASIDEGVNLIDTAPAYGAGHAEEVVGKAIRGLRDKVIITTKCGVIREPGKFIRDLRPETIRRDLEGSLKRLGVDYIDVYLLHWPDENTPLEVSIEEIAKLKGTGKFRYFGVSNFSLKKIDIISKTIPVEVLQPQYSVLFRDRKELMEACAKRGIGIMTYGSLAGGMLTGKFKEKPVFQENDTRSNMYPYFKEPLWTRSKALVDELEALSSKIGRPVSEIAINYAAQDKNNHCALIGAKTKEQAIANANAAKWVLSDEDRAFIDEVYTKHFND